MLRLMDILRVYKENGNVQGVVLKRIAKRAGMYEAVGFLHTQMVVPHILSSMRTHPNVRKVQVMGLHALSAILLHTDKASALVHVKPHVMSIVSLADAAQTTISGDPELARHTKALLSRLL